MEGPAHHAAAHGKALVDETNCANFLQHMPRSAAGPAAALRRSEPPPGRAQRAARPAATAQQGQQGAAPLRPAAGGGPAAEPYRLRAVGHSLGAGTLLIYAVVSRLLGRPHRLKRLVLLAPAGFHRRQPLVFAICKYLVPLLVRGFEALRGTGCGFPAYLPSSLLRYITFKLTMDLDQIPGLNELTKWVVGGGLLLHA